MVSANDRSRLALFPLPEECDAGWPLRLGAGGRLGSRGSVVCQIKNENAYQCEENLRMFSDGLGR